MSDAESPALIQRLKVRLCPHWYWKKPVPDQPVMFEIHDLERCAVCGHKRYFVTLPPVHPSRDPDENRSDDLLVDFVEVGERTTEVEGLD